MIWVDYLLLAIIVISTLLSLWRGFVREALSLASWLAALWIAMLFFEDLAGWLATWIDTPSVRSAVAFAILFVSTVLVGGLVGYLAGQLVARTGLTATDRALGMVFGVARGVVIVAVLVMLAGLTTVPQDPWWSESLLLPHFQEMALWLRSFLPADIADHIQY
ncbi:MAG TPA: CvpA family protein [Gammaproteobacteria bacterium]|nr:CvpA family protein [Gammaproteobacteria bacterium]